MSDIKISSDDIVFQGPVEEETKDLKENQQEDQISHVNNDPVLEIQKENITKEESEIKDEKEIDLELKDKNPGE